MRVEVHPRITQRHPSLSEEDVRNAWRKLIAWRPRFHLDCEQCIAIGTDQKGRLIEMVATKAKDGRWVIFHAMTPPTKKALVELGVHKR